MSKHSQGPWRRDGYKNDATRSVIIRDATGFEVACTRHFTIAETEANARLIAAAPDLLEFAQQVAQVAKNHNNLFIQAWAESVCENAGFPVVLKDEVTP